MHAPIRVYVTSPRARTAGETILPKDQHDVHPPLPGKGPSPGSLPRCTLPHRMPLPYRTSLPYRMPLPPYRNRAALPGSWKGTSLAAQSRTWPRLLFNTLVLFIVFTASSESAFAVRLAIPSRHADMLMVRNHEQGSGGSQGTVRRTRLLWAALFCVLGRLSLSARSCGSPRQNVCSSSS